MSSDLTLIKAGTGILTKSGSGSLDRAALVHLVAAAIFAPSIFLPWSFLNSGTTDLPSGDTAPIALKT